MAQPGPIQNDEFVNGSLSSGDETREQKKERKAQEKANKTGDKILKSAKNNVKKSKYTRINYMTIPQMKAAKAVLDKKIKDCGANKDYAMVNKLQDLHNEYTNSERQINKYYQRVSTNPLTAHILRGKRDILTIATIKGGKFKEDKGMKYGMGDWLRDVNASKIAMGVGIAAMGMSALTFKIGGKSILSILKEVLGPLLRQNPLAMGLLLGGASLVTLSKLCPAIARTRRKIKNHKAVVNQAQNDLSEEAAKEENNMNMTSLGHADFADHDKLAQAFIDNPQLKEQSLYYATTGRMPDGQVLTYNQKMNILKAIQKVEGKEKELRDLQEKANPTKKEDPKPEEKKEDPKKEDPKKEEKKEPVSPAVTNIEKEFKDLLGIDMSNVTQVRDHGRFTTWDKVIDKIKASSLDQSVQARLIEKAQAMKAQAEAARAAKKAQAKPAQAMETAGREATV
ncbi:MAG: hypothetical protein IJX17_01335 [Clostridia bacterium]|nr:hypothetical protein [Clostridia bacterium]